MFWPHDPSSQGNTLPKPWPWVTFALMLCCLVFYLLSLSGRGTEKKIQKAKDQVICYYLKNDYTLIPPKTLEKLPKEVRHQHKRTSHIIKRYNRAPAMSQAQGRKWLEQGDWDTATGGIDEDKDLNCIQQAAARGQLSRDPKRRLFIAMARLSPSKQRYNQNKLNILVKKYEATRLSHPLYGWGLIPKEGRWFTLLTSMWIAPAALVLLWQLLFLYLLGSFMERRWRQPYWLVTYLLTGLLGNVLILVLGGKQSLPAVGGGVALASIVGMWTFLNIAKKVQIAYWKPGAAQAGVLTLPGWSLSVAWLALALLSALVVQPYFLAHIIALVVGLVLGALVLFALEAFRLVEVSSLAESAPAALVQGRSFIQQTIDTVTRTGIQVAKKTTATKPKPADTALRARLAKEAEDALKAGNKELAALIYRDTLQSGKQDLWVWEALLDVFEQSGTFATGEEYLRAIRAAANEKKNDKVRRFFDMLMRPRHANSIKLSARECLNLAADLKRVGFLKEAIEELDEILDAGEESAFFIKATLLKAESMLQLSTDPQEVIALLNEAQDAAHSFPQFHDALERTRRRAELRLQSQGSAGVGIRSKAAGVAVVVEEPSANRAPAVAKPKSAAFAPPAPALGAATDESQEIDSSLLEEIEMFEALRQPSERESENAHDSWSELPSLMLAQETARPKDDDMSMFAPKPASAQKIGPADDDGLTSTQRLAEEVTAAFSVEDLQPKKGELEWASDWGDEEEEGFVDDLGESEKTGMNIQVVSAPDESLDNEEEAAFEEAFSEAFSFELGMEKKEDPMGHSDPFVPMHAKPATPKPATSMQPEPRQPQGEEEGYNASVPSLLPLTQPAKKPRKDLMSTRQFQAPIEAPDLLPEDEALPRGGGNAGAYAPKPPPGLSPSGRPPKQPTKDAWAAVGYPSHVEFEDLSQQEPSSSYQPSLPPGIGGDSDDDPGALPWGNDPNKK